MGKGNVLSRGGPYRDPKGLRSILIGNLGGLGSETSIPVWCEWLVSGDKVPGWLWS